MTPRLLQRTRHTIATGDSALHRVLFILIRFGVVFVLSLPYLRSCDCVCSVLLTPRRSLHFSLFLRDILCTIVTFFVFF
jgi:hypothetical protein